MTSPRIDPPLPAWPREVHPFEPAHGYFRRLAAANAQVSVRTLGSYVGVNGRNFDRDELLEFCSQFPSIGIEQLEHWTPRVDGTLVEINGERVSLKMDYKPYRPRVCSSCLRDSYFYRNWFDLAAVGICPIHGEPLCDLNADAKMAFWQADLGQPSSLTCSASQALELRSFEWERYVLGRMGVVERVSVAVLDRLPLDDVIGGCVLLGTGFLANEASSSQRRALPRHQAAAAGFDFLRHGEDGVEQCFIAIAGRARKAAGENWRGTTVYNCFGWAGSAIERNLPSDIRELCQAGFERAVERLGLYRRSTRYASTPRTDTHLTLGELADRTRLPRSKTRLIAHRLGLVPITREGSQTYWFSPEQVQTFVALLADLVDRPTAAEMFGLDTAAFDAVANELGLEPWTRLSGHGPSFDQFRGSEVLVARANLECELKLIDGTGIPFEQFCRGTRRSMQDVAAEIVSGDQPVVRLEENGAFQILLAAEGLRTASADGPKPRKSSRVPGISYADAAARLNISNIAITRLVEAGHLAAEHSGSGRLRRVDQASLDWFEAKYAALGAYARALGLSPQEVLLKFRSAGVVLIDRDEQQRVRWADRASVMSAMGPDWDLRGYSDPFASEIWEAFRHHLSTTRSANRLIDGTATTARLRSGSGYTLLHLSTSAEGGSLTATARAVRSSAPEWFSLIGARQDEISSFWPESEASVAADQITIEATYGLGLGPVDGGLTSTVRAIDAVASRLRMLRLRPQTS